MANISLYLERERKRRIETFNIQSLIIYLEGTPGSGKTTQGRSLDDELTHKKIASNFIRETRFNVPSSQERRTYMEEIRRTHDEDPEKSLELFTQERKEVWEQYILNIAQGKRVIILDRSFYSTLLRQALLRKIEIENNNKELEKLIRRMTPEPIIHPHLTLFTTCTATRAMERSKEKTGSYIGSSKNTFDETYIAVYKKVNGKESTPEIMGKWWIRENIKGYKKIQELSSNIRIIQTGSEINKLNNALFQEVLRTLKKYSEKNNIYKDQIEFYDKNHKK